MTLTPSRFYYLCNKKNGNFLNGHNGVTMWHWVGNDEQQWKIQREDNNYYTLQCQETDKFLSVGKHVDRYVEQDMWQGPDIQYWKIQDAGSNYYTLQSKESDKFMDGGDRDLFTTKDILDKDRILWRIFPSDISVEDAAKFIKMKPGTEPHNIGDIPRLTGFEGTPPKFSNKILIGEIAVPCMYVKDKDPVWQVRNSPYYKLSRYGYWLRVFYNEESGLSEKTVSENIKVGYEHETSQTIEKTMSIEVISGAEFAFKGLSMNLAPSFKRELKVSSSETKKTIRSYDKTITTTFPGGKRIAYAKWFRCDEYSLERGDGEKLVQWTVTDENISKEDVYPNNLEGVTSKLKA